MQGLGLLSGDNFLGMTGRFGTPRANAALEACDVLLLLGTRVAERTVAEPRILKKARKIIHIDIDPAEIKKNITPNVAVVGDCKNIIPILTKLIKPAATAAAFAAGAPAAAPATASPSPAVVTLPDRVGFVNPMRFLKALSETSQNAAVAADVGQSLIWTALSFETPERILTSGGMGTMGYAIPAAVGAKIAAPEKTVYAVCGDGAFMMSLSELAAIKEQNLDIKIIVFVNNSLGMVREYQKNRGDSPFAVTMTGNPDILKLAESFGIPALRVRDNSEIDEAVKTITETRGVFITECVVSPDEFSKPPEVTS
jgi:acetolactate synthase-1/2/3 large subunit